MPQVKNSKPMRETCDGTCGKLSVIKINDTKRSMILLALSTRKYDNMDIALNFSVPLMYVDNLQKEDRGVIDQMHNQMKWVAKNGS